MKLTDLIAQLAGALANSEGQDFHISADFVRDELIPALASSAEPVEVIDPYVMDLVRQHGSTMTNAEIVQKFLPKERLSAPPEREGFVSVDRRFVDKVAEHKEVFDSFDGDRRGIAESLYEAERTLIDALLTAASQNAQEDQ